LARWALFLIPIWFMMADSSRWRISYQ
jgi:hypothetical protein